MPKPLSITPASKPIKAYYAALRDLAAQQVDHEQAVRSAFQTLLTDLARPLKWTAIPELGKKIRTLGKKTRIVPDGTLRDRFQLPRGYWEAKDSADNLDEEIRSKLKKGYPTDNTIFWTPAAAVLFQGGAHKLKVTITENGDNPNLFCDLLNAFFTYVDKPLVDFDEAVETFTERVPAVGAELARIIADAHKSHKKFQEAFAAFFDLCKTTLNPNISRPAVDEMLVQHLLTKRLFRSVFRNPEFLQKNVIAAEVEKVITALSSKHFNPEQFLASLDHFYIAIENAADRVHDWSSKQHFLNTVYERFFQGYCVKTADTHGIVYTPQPIVDFMCASVEWVLEHEFGKKLGDDGVNILDPCTGTGNFVVNLMKRAADRGTKHLRYMYAEQLFANEIMLMPYYIAALNIEHEYFEHTDDYEPFEGLCFVDTLDLAEARQHGLFAQANLARVDRQKKTDITVVVGNPPYNVGQTNENDNNKNRKYNVIDGRIRTTYVERSSATLNTKTYDAYIRFFRWATDRLDKRPGVVCFVSNNYFLRGLALDGFRHCVAREFDHIWHLDLGGNVRDKTAPTGGNVFGIRVGVGITLLVRKKARKINAMTGVTCPVDYAVVSPKLNEFEKLRALANIESPRQVKWQRLATTDQADWFGQGSGEFRKLVPLGDQRGRSADTHTVNAVFKTYSPGVSTNRDDTCYSFSKTQLQTTVSTFCDRYNSELDRYKRAVEKKPLQPEEVTRFIDGFADYDRLKWSRNLKRHLRSLQEAKALPEEVRTAAYRPYSRRWLYSGELVVDERGWMPECWPTSTAKTLAIVVSDKGSRSPTASALMTEAPPDLHFAASADGHQYYPFEVVSSDDENMGENITDYALSLFRSHFAAASPKSASKARKISKWNIFHYVYALLHHPGYRAAFADNLKRELPRIPLAKSYADFASFAEAGEALSKLHLNYDDEKIVKPHKLREVWTLTDEEGRKRPKSFRVEDKMRLNKEKTSLRVNPTLTLEGIPPEVYRYRLGNRSALEWVIDQYQVYTDPKSNITSDCNAWGDERNDDEYIVRLVKQVVTVSLETLRIIDALPKDYGGPPISPGGADLDSALDPDESLPPVAFGDQNQPHPKFELRKDSPPRQGRLPRQ